MLGHYVLWITSPWQLHHSRDCWEKCVFSIDGWKAIRHLQSMQVENENESLLAKNLFTLQIDKENLKETLVQWAANRDTSGKARKCFYALKKRSVFVFELQKCWLSFFCSGWPTPSSCSDWCHFFVQTCRPGLWWKCAGLFSPLGCSANDTWPLLTQVKRRRLQH